MGSISSVEAAPPGGRPAPRTVAEAGYVEEEHWVRGTADLYGYDEDGTTGLVQEGIGYTTRAVVRRPADPALATGDVLIEPLHPAGDMSSSWPRLGTALLREGWTWVGVTQDVAGLAATQAADADRYGHLALPHRGLGFDVVAQVAAFLRAEGLPGVRLDHLFMSGASYTGTFQRVFLADGFHDRTRRPGGGPAVEGYLIQISSGAFMLGGYLPLNSKSPVPPAGDRRRVVGPHDVPVIELLSEGEAETNRDSRRPDADEADDRYRLYEVPGACHMSAGEADTNLPTGATLEEPSDFPMYAIASGALANLRRWAVEGVAPPTAPRIELHDHRDAGPCGSRDECLPPKRDEHGNALGGVRTPHLDVPVARYFPHSTLRDPAAGDNGRVVDLGDLMGCMERFPPEKLRALYGTPARYRERYEAGIVRLLDEGWILGGDAERLRRLAATVAF